MNTREQLKKTLETERKQYQEKIEELDNWINKLFNEMQTVKAAREVFDQNVDRLTDLIDKL